MITVPKKLLPDNSEVSSVLSAISGMLGKLDVSNSHLLASIRIITRVSHRHLERFVLSFKISKICQYFFQNYKFQFLSDVIVLNQRALGFLTICLAVQNVGNLFQLLRNYFSFGNPVTYIEGS